MMTSNYEVKITQQMLNRLGFQVKADGILGARETAPALKAFSSMVKKVFEQKGYSYEIGFLNLVGLRLEDRFDNMFTDVYAFVDFFDTSRTRLFPCSTRPGMWGKGTVSDPIWVDGVYGVAVLKEGQYKSAYQLQGAWWSGYPFLYQVKPVTVWRDYNKDRNLDKVQARTGMFGINHHTWTGHDSQYVNRLSIGCQVFQSRYIDYIHKYWQKSIVTIGDQNLITYTLLEWK